MRARILILPHDKAAAIVKPGQYLGPHFNAYKDICQFAGARWSKTDGGNLVSFEALLRLGEELTKAGFGVEVDPKLAAQLKAKAEEARAEAERAGALTARAVERAAAQGFTLWKFQVEGVGMLSTHADFLLGDQMGLGKTPQATCPLPEPGEGGTLVVAPASVKGVWRRTVKAWRPDLHVSVLSGRGSFRWPELGEVVITNYDILPSDAPPCPHRVQMIADEAHLLKNTKAQRNQRWRALGKRAKAAGGGRWLLTGTPLLNRRNELWNVLSCADLAEEAFASWPAFQNMSTGEVADRLKRVMLMRRRADVLPDLPGKIQVDREVELDPKGVAEIERVRAELAARGIDLDAAMRTAVATASEKVDFTELSTVRRLLATAMIPAALAIADEYEEQDEPVVMVSAHAAPIEALGARPGWAVIVGGMTGDQKTEVEERFQRGELKGVAMTIQAGGVGITLTRAAHLVFIDKLWTPALNEQCEDRICRIGQTRGCIITTLVPNHSTFVRVQEVNEGKSKLIASAVEAAAVVQVERRDVAAALEALAAAPEARVGPDGKPVQGGGEAQAVAGFSERREAKDAVERWAAAGLIALARMDTDHASVINGMGFSKMDGKFGHSLADQVGRSGRLSPRQWEAAVKLANRYRRQIGPKPAEAEAA